MSVELQSDLHAQLRTFVACVFREVSRETDDTGGTDLRQFCRSPDRLLSLCTSFVGSMPLLSAACSLRHTVRAPVLSSDALRAQQAVDAAVSFFEGDAGPGSLHLSERERRVAVVCAWLVFGGADPSSRVAATKQTAPMIAAAAGNCFVAALLVHMVCGPSGEDWKRTEALLDARDAQGNTLLHYFAEACSPFLFMRIVAAYGADRWKAKNLLGQVAVLRLVSEMCKQK